jgi:hypothetical protein
VPTVQAHPGAEMAERPPPPNMTLEQRVRATVEGVRANWMAKDVKSALELVTITVSNGAVIVKPKKFLGNDWTPINVALKKVFGDHWVKLEGDDKKDSHWEYRE